MYTTFINILQSLFDKLVLALNITLKTTEICRPWILNAIRKSINKKHALYKNYQKLRSTEAHLVYKAYRNKLTTIIRKKEKMHYLHKLENVKDNC